jgi:hypothetical protein
MDYVYLGTQTECLESGRPLAFGDVTEEADQRLIDAGLLVPAPSDAPAKPAPVAPVTSNEKEASADASGT